MSDYLNIFIKYILHSKVSIIILLFGLSPLSCSDGSFTEDSATPPLPPPTLESHHVVLSLPIAPSPSSKLYAFWDSAQLSTVSSTTGETELSFPVTTAPQLVFYRVDGDRVLPLLVTSTTGKTIEVTAEALVLGIVWLRPYLISLPSRARTTFLEAITLHTREDLDWLTSYAEYQLKRGRFDPEHDYLFQKRLEELIRKTFETSSQPRLAPLREGFSAQSDPPRVDIDTQRNQVLLVNPKATFYSAKVYKFRTASTQILLLSPKQGLAGVRLGWPPVYLSEPTVLKLDLPPQEPARIQLFKFFDRTNEPNNFWDPRSSASAIAGYANLLLLVSAVLDLATGFNLDEHAFIKYIKIIQKEKLSEDYKLLATSLYDAIQGDWLDAFEKLMRVASNHWDLISYWIWQEVPGLATADFLKQLGVVLKKFTGPLGIALDANEYVPLLWDVAFAPWYVIECLPKNMQSDQCVPKNPPVLIIQADRVEIKEGGSISFNAGQSYDPEGGPVEVRWDFEGDGVWDTAWVPARQVVSHSYAASGRYTVHAEGRDQQNSLSRQTLNIFVRPNNLPIPVDISGYWKGILTQYPPVITDTYNFELYLTQGSDGTITGTTRVSYGNEYGIMEVLGEFDILRQTIRLEERRILEEYIRPGYGWCIKLIYLFWGPANPLRLEGVWNSYLPPFCGTGDIYVDFQNTVR